MKKHDKLKFSDLQIAGSIKLINEPETVEGESLVSLICKTALSSAIFSSLKRLFTMEIY